MSLQDGVSEPALIIQLFTTRRHGPVQWRVLARNHREVARGAETYGTPEDARRALAELLHDPLALSGSCFLVRPHTWKWDLTHSDRLVACSSRVFDRQPRCQAALQHATTNLASALLVDKIALYATV